MFSVSADAAKPPSAVAASFGFPLTANESSRGSPPLPARGDVSVSDSGRPNRCIMFQFPIP